MDQEITRIALKLELLAAKFEKGSSDRELVLSAARIVKMVAQFVGRNND